MNTPCCAEGHDDGFECGRRTVRRRLQFSSRRRVCTLGRAAVKVALAVRRERERRASAGIRKPVRNGEDSCARVLAHSPSVLDESPL